MLILKNSKDRYPIGFGLKLFRPKMKFLSKIWYGPVFQCSGRTHITNFRRMLLLFSYQLSFIVQQMRWQIQVFYGKPPLLFLFVAVTRWSHVISQSRREPRPWLPHNYVIHSLIWAKNNFVESHSFSDDFDEEDAFHLVQQMLLKLLAGHLVTGQPHCDIYCTFVVAP